MQPNAATRYFITFTCNDMLLCELRFYPYRKKKIIQSRAPHSVEACDNPVTSKYAHAGPTTMRHARSILRATTTVDARLLVYQVLGELYVVWPHGLYCAASTDWQLLSMQ